MTRCASCWLTSGSPSSSGPLWASSPASTEARLTTALYDASFGGHRLPRSSHVRSVLNTTGEAIGEQTATRDLTSLAELGYLVTHGERRARFYVVSGQLTQIYLRIRNRVTEQLDNPPTPQA